PHRGPVPQLVAPTMSSFARLLDPCHDTWAGHFEVHGDHLLPRAGDEDAGYTHDVFKLDDPARQCLRRFRRETLGEAREAWLLDRNRARRLLRLAERVAREDRVEVLEAAEAIRRSIRGAAAILRHFAPVPDDADSSCRCGSDGVQSLPEFLERQIEEIAPAPAEDDG
ncbi:MAG: hypothetical protein QME96_13000, partial [Myxococcota bacterium]|nr:hypothetical protein [Myxococcota bacterium]